MNVIVSCSARILNGSRYSHTFWAGFFKFFGGSRYCRLSSKSLSNVAPNIRLSPELAGNSRQSCLSFEDLLQLSTIENNRRHFTPRMAANLRSLKLIIDVRPSIFSAEGRWSNVKRQRSFSRIGDWWPDVDGRFRGSGGCLWTVTQ
jgi:hypothetical protein